MTVSGQRILLRITNYSDTNYCSGGLWPPVFAALRERRYSQRLSL